MSFTRTSGGLLVPEGAQEAAVDAALRRHDPDLRLVPQDSDAYGRRVYKVYRYNGPDRPADLVCVWWDRDLQPIPLSMALVEMVQLHDKQTVGRMPTVDEETERVRAEKKKDYLRDAEAIVKEFGPKLDEKKHTLIPRSRGLQVARQKVRAKQRNPGWRP
jgi:hypothetical protein